jgi:hypothetical protein
MTTMPKIARPENEGAPLLLSQHAPKIESKMSKCIELCTKSGRGWVGAGQNAPSSANSSN